MSTSQQKSVTKTTVLQSTEGLNLDLWQTFDLKNLLPKALQKLIAMFTKLLDKAQAVLEYMLAAVKAASSAISTFFDILRKILNAIREAILSLLNLFPLLDAGVYFLFIPVSFGGNDYYLRTFKNSLTDQNDPRRPSDNPDLLYHAMFFMAGATWVNQNKLDTFNNLLQAATSVADFFGAGTAESTPAIDPPGVIGFTVEKGFFSKSTTSTSVVTNTVSLPAKEIGGLGTGSIDNINNSVEQTTQKLRLAIAKTLNINTAGGAAVSFSLSWKFSKNYSRPSYEKTVYTSNHAPEENRYEYLKSTTKLHGVYILRTINDDIMKEAYKVIPSYLKRLGDFPTSATSVSLETKQGNATLIIYPLTKKDLVTSTINYIDDPVDAENTKHLYSIAPAYAIHKQIRAITATDDGKYKVTEYYQFSSGLKTDIDPKLSTEEILDAVEYTMVHPKDVDFNKLTETLTADARVLAGNFSVPITKTSSTSHHPAIAPNWSSFSLLEDLFPKVKQVLDYIRAKVNNIIDGLLEDLTVFERYVKAMIRKIEVILEDAIDFIKLLRSLLMFPMAGISYLSTHSNQGSQGIAKRLEEALEYALLPVSGSYNPAILDVDFQKQNPAEYQRRMSIPSYSENELTCGFVLMFQEPQIKKFLQDMFNFSQSGIYDDLMTEFRTIRDNAMRDLSRISEPRLKFPPVVNHELVFTGSSSSNPSEYARALSKYKKGADTVDPPVNDSGNVEQKSSKTHPYTVVAPVNLSIAIEEDVFIPVLVPTGSHTNQHVVDIINASIQQTQTQEQQTQEQQTQTQTQEIAFIVADGSFVLEAPHLQISSCSFEAAQLLGLPAPLSITAPEDVVYAEEQFTYTAGDLLIELQGEGPPTLAMLGSTPPIFQVKAMDLYNSTNDPDKSKIGPDACYIKMKIEDSVETIIDVTGNNGSNPQATSAMWELTATYPLEVKDKNKLKIEVTTSSAIQDKYNNFTEWEEQLAKLKTEAEGRTHTPLEYTEKLNKPTPIHATPQTYEIAIQNGTYKTPQILMGAILAVLHGSYEENEDGSQAVPRYYPVGLLTTEVDENPVSTTADTKTYKSRLVFEDTEAHNSQNAIKVTAVSNQNESLLEYAQNTVNIPGIDAILYTNDQILENLNKAIPSPSGKDPYFSINDGILRITGSKVGEGNKIQVFTSDEEITNESNSKQYHKTASALFGIRHQKYNMDVEGIGEELTSNTYTITLENQKYCMQFENNSVELYKVDLDSVLEYTVEIENSIQLECVIV